MFNISYYLSVWALGNTSVVILFQGQYAQLFVTHIKQIFCEEYNLFRLYFDHQCQRVNLQEKLLK